MPLLPPGPLGGLLAPLWAAGFLLRRPRLWPWLLAPLLINLGLFALAFWLGVGWFDRWLAAVLPGGEGLGWRVLFYLLLVLGYLLFLAATVYLFALAGRVLAAPFLELLTRRVELAAGGGGEWAEVGFLAGLGRAALQEGKKLLLYLALWRCCSRQPAAGVGTALYAGLAAGHRLVLPDFVIIPERRDCAQANSLSAGAGAHRPGLRRGLPGAGDRSPVQPGPAAPGGGGGHPALPGAPGEAAGGGVASLRPDGRDSPAPAPVPAGEGTRPSRRRRAALPRPGEVGERDSRAKWDVEGEPSRRALPGRPNRRAEPR